MLSVISRSRLSSTGVSACFSNVAAGWRNSEAWGSSAGTDSQFGAFAENYDRHRPGYPDAVFDRLLEVSNGGNDSAVVDCAAGTGRAALALAERGARVVATDSDSRMLKTLQDAAGSRNLNVRTAKCTAEDLDKCVNGGSVNLITCFQAFHWFTADEALPAFARVLGPNGVLGVAWNDRDLGVDWICEMEALIEKYNPKYSRMVKQSDEWEEVLTKGGHFERIGAATPEAFSHSVSYESVEEVVKLCMTYSYVKNALNQDEAASLQTELREMLYRNHGSRPFHLPYETKLYLLRKS